jgi:hypothetical protein
MPDHEGNVMMPDLNTPDVGDGSGGGDDSGGWGAKLFAKLDLSLGKLESTTAAQSDNLRKLRMEARNMPAITTISSVFTWAAGTAIAQQGGAGAGVLIGGPEVGQQWHVRSILVGGTTLTATPAGVAWFLISPAPPLEQSITSVVDWTKVALPTNAFYGIGEFYLPPNTNLYMIVTGGTAGVQYVASITFQSSKFVPQSDQIDN